MEPFNLTHRKNIVKMMSSLGNPAIYQRGEMGTLNTYAIVSYHTERTPQDFEMQMVVGFVHIALIKDAIPSVREGDRIGAENIIYTVNHLLNDDGYIVDVAVTKTGEGSIPSVPWDPIGDLQKLDGLDYFAFNWGDATPKLLFTLTKNKVVSEVVLHISEAFDGVGSKLQIGDAVVKGRLMSELENLPGVVGSYMTHPNHTYTQDTGILLTITLGTGNAQGKGIVEIKYQD